MARRTILGTATLCLAGIVGAAGCAPKPPAAADPGAIVRAVAPPKAIRKYDFRRCLSSIWLSEDRSLLVGATDMGRICLVDVSSGKELFSKEIPDKHGLPYVAFAPGGQTAYLVFGGAIYTLRAPSGPLRKTPMVVAGDPRPDACSLAFSPDGGRLAVGYSSGAIVLWDPVKEKQVRELAGHRDNHEDVDNLIFSADGKRLVSGSRDGTIRLWDLSTGEEIRKIAVAGDAIEPNGSPEAIYEVRFLPGSGDRRLFSAGFDGTLRLWDLDSGEELRRIRVHKYCLAVAVTPDGKTLITGGYIDGVRLWDTATGEMLLEVPDHPDGVLNVEVAGDGRTVVVGDYEGMALLIDIPALGAGGQPAAEALSDREMNDLWTTLASKVPAESFRAACRLANGGDRSAAFLGRRLGAADESLVKMNQAIAKLDSDEWTVREAASRELEGMGPSIEPMLLEAEKAARSAEAKTRLAAIVAKLQASPKRDPPDYRLSRAVQSLEWMGSSRALAVLELLAQGGRGPACAQDAKSACERMRSKGIRAAPWDQ